MRSMIAWQCLPQLRAGWAWVVISISMASNSSQQVDRTALEFVTSDGLPSHFACWKSCDAVLSAVNKTELQARAIQLGLETRGQTPAQMIKSIASVVIAKGNPPRHMVCLRLLCNDNIQTQDLKCWKCGKFSKVSADSLVDLKCGSWPPGDSRRWRIDDAFVVPAIVCTYQKAQHTDDAGTEAGRAYASTPCNVGNYKTVSHVYWNEQFLSVPDVMRAGGSALPDGLLECPTGPCLERVCLQLLNWFSMSGQDSADKNYLPARVYLTREARLVCRGGGVVGFVTYNSQASVRAYRRICSTSPITYWPPRQSNPGHVK